MKTASLLLLLGALLTGCIPSLHPLYTQTDTIYDPLLVGTWVDKDGKNAWQFAPSEDKKSYQLTMTDNQHETGVFKVYMVKLGEVVYLDLTPDEMELKANGFYKWHLQPMHTFMRIRQVTPNLQMAMLNPKFLEQAFKTDPDAPAHDKAGDRTIFTAPTADLQRYLKAHDKDPKLWGEYMDLLPKAATPK